MLFLPVEISLQIIHYLGPSDTCNCRLISKGFYFLIENNEEIIWQSKYLLYFPSTRTDVMKPRYKWKELFRRQCRNLIFHFKHQVQLQWDVESNASAQIEFLNDNRTVQFHVFQEFEYIGSVSLFSQLKHSLSQGSM